MQYKTHAQPLRTYRLTTYPTGQASRQAGDQSSGTVRVRRSVVQPVQFSRRVKRLAAVAVVLWHVSVDKDSDVDGQGR